MISQTEIILKPRTRGFHLITDDIMRCLPELPETGMLNLFVQHTSCALALNENADPSVRTDLESIFNGIIPDDQRRYTHTFEGEDDMPAHAKSLMTGVSINIPITNGHLNLGTWQGVYLCEFRDYGGERHIVATVMGQ